MLQLGGGFGNNLWQLKQRNVEDVPSHQQKKVPIVHCGFYLIEKEVWVDEVACEVRRAGRTALFVAQVRAEA
jgi:hypothetical protein